MDKKFDFNQIGKRMPYSTPDNFFDKLEKEVKTSLPNKSKHRRNRIIVMSILSAAASLLLIFGIGSKIDKNNDDANNEKYGGCGKGFQQP